MMNPVKQGYPGTDSGYPPQVGYPSQQTGYPPQQAGYPPQQAGYPPQQVGYPPQQAGYLPQQAGYPPQQAGYPPQQAGYPPQQAGYPFPSGGDPSSAYPKNPPSYNEAAYGNNGPDVNTPGVQVTQPINFTNSFSDKVIRLNFIRRVYFILTCQLLVTVGFICLFIFHEGVKNYVQQNLALYIAAYVIFLVTYIALVCCSKLRMKFPTNFILLSIFTIALSYMVGMISSFHKTEIVLYAMGICAACCLCVTCFAIQTKFDFTKWGGTLFIIFLVVFFFGIFAVIMRHKILTVVYSALIALVFMAFLAYDTQMVIGGNNRKFQLGPEEYINGALQLYMDIVQIFLAILSLTSSSSN